MSYLDTFECSCLGLSAKLNEKNACRKNMQTLLTFAKKNI